MSAYLEISRLSKSYPTPKGPAVIVKDFDLKVKKGEFVSIIGHSGCGKSTVLMMVAGLNPLTEGGIILAGKELDGPGPDRMGAFGKQGGGELPVPKAIGRTRAEHGRAVGVVKRDRGADFRRSAMEVHRRPMLQRLR